ncbi:MAG: indole-3-glycerol phosphate synthase TrpC [Anaerolineaceae bacterium]|nr:indole-3-glycerol phosphate synthase TrpC [Anaerolineaceae bacterium]
MNILAEIFAHKRVEVAEQQARVPMAAVRAAAEAARPTLDFVAALRRPPEAKPRLIAEIKRASPSRGLLAPIPDPTALAQVYMDNGAAAISVLTDSRYFQGSLDDLRAVAGMKTRVPLLRKDFLCDPYQVYQARAAGADAVLLIAASLDEAQLRDLHALASELGLAVLVEVHDENELEKAFAACNPGLVGVNNRNLRDFNVRLETTLALRTLVPAGVCMVAESGIRTAADVERLREVGVDAILVGEALVTAPDPAAKVRSLAQ